MRVPTALIRHACFEMSYRLPPLEVLAFPVPEPANPWKSGYAGTPRSFVPVTVLPTTQLVMRKGNLINDDYRFFIGTSIETSTISRCRWCSVELYTKTARNDHNPECKTKLLKLYQRLRKDRSCVVCDIRTGKNHWGIPLCSNKCIDLFKFCNSEAFIFERGVDRGDIRRRISD